MSETGRDGWAGGVPLNPPKLVHFTTADLNHIAEGKYDRAAIAAELKRAHGVVLISPHHLIEWLPKFENAPERFWACVMLPEVLPFTVFVDWSAGSAWRGEPLQRPILTTARLLALFFADKDCTQPRQELRDERRRLILMGEADFASRNAERGLDDHVAKYQKLNDRHGSDVTKMVERANHLTELILKVAPSINRVVPDSVRRTLAEGGLKLGELVRQVEPRLMAQIDGVSPSNPGFSLQRQVRERLLANPNEQGGIGERVDLAELVHFYQSWLFTADKRMEPTIRQVLRDRGEEEQHGWRLIRCGDGDRILDVLRALPDDSSTL